MFSFFKKKDPCQDNLDGSKNHHWHIVESRKTKVRKHPTCAKYPETLYYYKGNMFFHIRIVKKIECCFCKKQRIKEPEDEYLFDLEDLHKMKDVDDHPLVLDNVL